MTDFNELNRIARQIRADVVRSIWMVKSGHPGGSLSAVDIITALYFEKMNVRPLEPEWPGRDRFVLSKGHAAPALYAALARKGFFPLSELNRLRQIDSHLQGAPNLKTPGIDMSAGPLGQGLSAAVGMALAARLTGYNYRVYCMVGDGEVQEGQIWEAAMAAAKFKLSNLILILDHNGVQMSGTNDEMMPLGDLEKKFQAFGWQTISINGNDMKQVVNALYQADSEKEKPVLILAETVKGKGVSYMEGRAKWHGAVPSDDEYYTAMKELGVNIE